MAKILTKEFSRELLKAMGCPIDQCQSVTINANLDNLVSVDIRYTVDPEWLKKASEAMVRKDGCGRLLASGQYWMCCGETDMGQTMPALCEECGGTLRLSPT